MIYSRTLAGSILLAAVMGLGACSMFSVAPMAPNVSSMSARLSGANEVPANSTNASGTLSANLDRQTRTLTWTVTYISMSGPATGGHFHGPATIGQNAGVALPFAGSLESPIRGSATLTDTQMTDLLNGRWYVNLHTAANPGGEIRGQLSLYP